MDNSNTYSAIEFDDVGRMLRSASGYATAEHAALCYGGSAHGVLIVAGEVPDILSRKHYILNGEVTERPTSPVTRTGLTLLDVPEGSTLWINGESYSAEGTVELEFTLPGTYSLRVECFPYLDWVDEVTVP